MDTLIVYLIAAQAKFQEAVKEEDGMEIIQTLGIASVAFLILIVLFGEAGNWGDQITAAISSYIADLSAN